MKELNFVFAEKIEFQHQGFTKPLALFDVPSIWRLERYVPLEVFSMQTFLLDSGESRIVKTAGTQKVKNRKVQFFTSITKCFNRFLNF